jgi:glycosyltransferase involved in cell wall biosynthesis
VTFSILWLGRTIPAPLNAGDRIYSAQLAGAVARQGAQVVFLGLENSDEPGGDTAQLDPWVRWQVVPGTPRPRLLSLFSRFPMVGARFRTEQYRRAIARELASKVYDVVVFDQYGMSWAIEDVQHLARNPPVLVHLSHDFETRVTDQIARNFSGDRIRKYLLRKNARKTRLAEQVLAHSSNLLVALTAEDHAAFNEINHSLECIVLPPGYAGVKLPDRSLDQKIPRRAIIVGSFSWIAKQINLERLLEAANVLFTRHQVELHVVGLVPHPFLTHLRSRFPWVVFRGFVEDLADEFRSARIALVPEEVGGGFKLKILDYIFSHVPVAAVETALNGIPSQLKSQFVIERDIPTLLATIVAVIDDIDRLNAMHNRAFKLAENLFNWDINGQRFLERLNSVTAGRSVNSLHTDQRDADAGTVSPLIGLPH